MQNDRNFKASGSLIYLFSALRQRILCRQNGLIVYVSVNLIAIELVM